jgi:hypothetical protein
VAPYVNAACLLKLLRGAKLPQQSAKLPEQRPFCLFILFYFPEDIVMSSALFSENYYVMLVGS